MYYPVLNKFLDRAIANPVLPTVKVYVATKDKTDEEFGTKEFKQAFEFVFSRIYPSYNTYAITSDEQFRTNADLVKALDDMRFICNHHTQKNYQSRAKGVEASWEQPYEHSWMEFGDELYEANIRQMF